MRRQGANLVHQRPNLMRGEFGTKRWPRCLAFDNLRVKRSILSPPDVRVGQVRRDGLKRVGFGAITFSCFAVAGQAIRLVGAFPSAIVAWLWPAELTRITRLLNGSLIKVSPLRSRTARVGRGAGTLSGSVSVAYCHPRLSWASVFTLECFMSGPEICWHR